MESNWLKVFLNSYMHFSKEQKHGNVSFIFSALFCYIPPLSDITVYLKHLLFLGSGWCVFVVQCWSHSPMRPLSDVYMAVWTSVNRLRLNPSKAKAIIFSFVVSPSPDVWFHLGNVEIECGWCHKRLCVIVDNDLSFGKHVDIITGNSKDDLSHEYTSITAH